jgi:WD40 repeat protein
MIGEPMAGHTGVILSVLFSPDNKYLATCSKDMTIRLWRIPSTHAIGEAGHEGAVYCAIFSSDNKRLASCSQDKTVRIWDIDLDENEGSVIRLARVLKGHDRAVRRITFSPDSKRLASCSEDNDVVLWDVGTGKMIRKLNRTSSIVFPPDNHHLVPSIIFSPDSNQLVSCSHDGTTHIWNARTSESINDGRIIHSTPNNSTALSPNSCLPVGPIKHCAICDVWQWDSVDAGQPTVSTSPLIVPVWVGDGWLHVNKQKTLWIPLLYRGGVVQMFMKDGNLTVCIGCNTGSVVYIRLPWPMPT